MDNKKYNRLTWHRKETNKNRHPKLIKDIICEATDNGFVALDDICDYLDDNKNKIINAINRQKENVSIVEAIRFFKYGCFSERKQYMAALRSGGATYNGYTFFKELYCWVIWKPTDLATQPQFKGDPLYKVIPDNVPIENIPAILDAQPWTYV